MYHYVICDDNQEAAEILEGLIMKYSDTKVSVKCSSDIKTANAIISDETDVLFMDIVLAEANGIDFASTIKERFPHLRIVFITAFTEYCEKIFKAQPIGFLVKPFKDSSVCDVLSLIKKSFRSSDAFLTIRTTKSSTEQIDLGSVIYIENHGRIQYFYGENGTVISEIRSRLSEIEKQLPYYIIRCHYSYCVNLKYVMNIQRFSFTLTDGREIPISQSRFIRSRDKYYHYLGDML